MDGTNTTARLEGKLHREYLTNAIKEAIDGKVDESKKHFVYANITNLIYKSLFGMTAEQLRQERHVRSKELRDFLTQEELILVSSVEGMLAMSIKKNDGDAYEICKEWLDKYAQY